ncbi:MAG: hypothetical protein KGJ87_07335 [Planctomycetota bacterium]|nr:hypothetical protein [Planctomycetota bacterium]MDE1890351.1 hypothetical protein [Planctomycetota bacterium]MDE2216953.1 hypothetical protein [Planctomycetota bacterium]
MDKQTFQEKLLNLIEEIKKIPETKKKILEMLEGEIGEKYGDLRKGLLILQENLDSLRLNVKYLLFDLEATKRENTALKKRIEELGNSK